MTLLFPVIFAVLFLVIGVEFLGMVAFVGRAMFNIASGATGIFDRLNDLQVEAIAAVDRAADQDIDTDDLSI